MIGFSFGLRNFFHYLALFSKKSAFSYSFSFLLQRIFVRIRSQNICWSKSRFDTLIRIHTNRKQICTFNIHIYIYFEDIIHAVECFKIFWLAIVNNELYATWDFFSWILPRFVMRLFDFRVFFCCSAIFFSSFKIEAIM